MENKEEETSMLHNLFERAMAYSRTSYELLKLNGLQKASGVVSSLVPRLIVFSTLVVFIITLNIGVALWLGEIFGKMYYGFFVVAGFYALAAIVLLVAHEGIKRSVSDSIIQEALN